MKSCQWIVSLIRIIGAWFVGTALVMGIYALNNPINANAQTANAILPRGGISLFLTESNYDTSSYSESDVEQVETVKAIATVEQMVEMIAQLDDEDEADVKKQPVERLVVAQTNTFIGVYEEPDVNSKRIGKLYNDCIGTIIGEYSVVADVDDDDAEIQSDILVPTAGSEEDECVDWYYIESGNVKGYIIAEGSMLTGEEAIARKEEIGTCYAVVKSETLFVRVEPDVESDFVEIVTRGDELLVMQDNSDGDECEASAECAESGTGEEVANSDDTIWIYVQTDEGEGWIDAEYAELLWKYNVAETRDEEADRLAKVSLKNGQDLVTYALNFVGNNYVWGGTSLTDGADCSGFTLTLYGMYGIELPHSSITQADYGVEVDGIENAQAGDLIVYAGHVAIYMGNGQIVHAANSRLGICVSGIDFMEIVCIRRLL